MASLKYCRKRSQQQGFSLIELMVALVLSLFLIAGLFYSVLGDMRSYDSTRGTQGLITKSRMSIQYIKLYLQQAGFRDLEQLKLNMTLSQKTDWDEGQLLRGFNAFSSATPTIQTGVNNSSLNLQSGSDIAVIRFLGDGTAADNSGSIFDCKGENLYITTPVTEHQIMLYINTSNELVCNDGTTTEILDQGIDNLRLLYGISDDDSYQYFTATQIESNNRWASVNRIKVGLLVSQEVQGNHLTNSRIYTLFDRDISAANDTNYRKVITETVLIRNIGD